MPDCTILLARGDLPPARCNTSEGSRDTPTKRLPTSSNGQIMNSDTARNIVKVLHRVAQQPDLLELFSGLQLDDSPSSAQRLVDIVDRVSEGTDITTSSSSGRNWCSETDLSSRITKLQHAVIARGSMKYPSYARYSATTPSLRAEALEALNTVTKLLDRLSPSPLNLTTVQLLEIVHRVCIDAQALVSGDEHIGLLQQCRAAHQQLKTSILGTAPNFRPFKSKEEDTNLLTGEVDGDIRRASDATRTHELMYLEDVRLHAQKYGLS